MNVYEVNQQSWNSIALTYQKEFMDLEIYNNSYDQFCRAIPKQGAKILEVGCGPGNISYYLLKQRPDFDLLGIDNAPNMIELAVKNNPAASYKVMDARNISKLDKRFDGIISGFCLPYLVPDDGKKLILDLYHLLHENGLFYLSFVEGDSRNSGLKTGSSGASTYFTYYDLKTIVDYLTSIGFRTVEITHLPYSNSKGESEIHALLLARKL